MSYNYNSQTGTYHPSNQGSYQHTQYSNTGYVNWQNYPQQGYASNGNTFNSNTWDLGTSFTSPMPNRQAPSIPDQTHTAGYFSSQYGKSPMEDFNLEDSAPLKENNGRDAKGRVIMVQILLTKSSNVSVNTISRDSWLRLHYAFTNLLENGDTIVAQLMLDYDRALHMSNVIILLDNELRGWVNMKLKENSHKGFVCHTRVQLGKTDQCLIEEAKKWNSHFLIMEEHLSSFSITNTLKSIQSSWNLPNIFTIGENYSRKLHPQCNLLILKGEKCKWQRFPFMQDVDKPNFPTQNPIPSPHPNFDGNSLPLNCSPPPVPDSPLSSDRSFNLRESSTWDESSNDFSKQPSAKSETSKNFTSPSQTKSSNSSSDSNRRSSFLDKESEVCSNANFSKMFTYEEVEEATEGFSRERKIGEGGFGEVYLGISANLGKIAVKVIKQKVKEHALQQLETELSLLQKINHKNVVKLLGFCVTEENLILVFEFVDGGSLKSRIRNSKLPPLTWNERVKIIQGSAEGLRYLHEGLSQPIIHRDIKSDNILITNTLIPKIADFGLAKETPNDQTGTWIFPETMIIGSNGYIAPEYVSNRQGTKSIDVFAFGVIILELLTGRPAYSKSLNPPALRNHVKQVVSSEESVLVLADPRFGGDFDAKQFERLIDVGIQCCKNNPKKRLKMEDVAFQLALLTLKS